MTAVLPIALLQTPNSTADTRVPVGHTEEFANLVKTAATPPTAPPPLPTPQPTRRRAYQYD